MTIRGKWHGREVAIVWKRGRIIVPGRDRMDSRLVSMSLIGLGEGLEGQSVQPIPGGPATRTHHLRSPYSTCYLAARILDPGTISVDDPPPPITTGDAPPDAVF